MSIHRCVSAAAIDFVQLDAPFSCFTYIERVICETDPWELEPVRRICSIARSREAVTLVVENIDADGIIADEVSEIKALYPEYQLKGLLRFSFWDKKMESDSENQDIVNDLCSELPGTVWMVELSTPHLFPANERKHGEIVLDATQKNDGKTELDLFVIARLPGVFVFGNEIDTDGVPVFSPIPSGLVSHTCLHSCIKAGHD